MLIYYSHLLVYFFLACFTLIGKTFEVSRREVALSIISLKKYRKKPLQATNALS